MIEISATVVIDAIAKGFLTLVVIGVVAMFVLWPINDQPISKTQKAVFAVLAIFVVLLSYDVIVFK